MFKRVILQLIVIIATCLVINVNNSLSDEKVSGWQQSESSVIQLSVRDKYSSLKEYIATFQVWNDLGPDQRWEKSITVLRDKWGAVFFPTDFLEHVKFTDDVDDYPKSGDYKWQVVVGGEMVGSGEFVLSTKVTKNDTAQVIRK